MLTKTQLTTMLKLQDRLNCVINPDWINANYPWHRAIMVEAVECLEHYGWKWWKKQEPDLAQARMELVDIWHFILSRALVERKGNIEWTAEYLDFLFGIEVLNSDPAAEKLDVLIRQAADGEFAPIAFIGLMQDFGLTWDELYTTYIAKNVLNIFRQDHGYRAGSYRKDWQGKEDNEVLATTMAMYPEDSPEQLYAKLESLYSEVCKTPITA